MGRSFAATDTSNYNLAKPYDIIYTKSPLAVFTLGIVKQNKNPHNAIVSPLYGVFSPVNRHVGQIIEAYFDSPFRSMRYLAPITQKGAKNTIQISNATFLSGELFLPDDEREQQTVAEFLTTLDELIGAHSQKLDALQAHKKGLIQQLFPHEGETVPYLRFPDFRDAPSWQEMDAGELISTVSAPRKLQTSSYLEKGTFPIVDQSQTQICGWTDDVDALVVGDFPLIVFGDHTCTLKLIKQPFAQGADGIKILKPKPFITAEFLYYALQAQPLTSEEYRRHFSLLQEKSVRFPRVETGEQQRVAGVLSCLDDLIAAQAQKLAALKTHRQGLMQQLFPLPEWVEA
ncbi:MAG TPA: hypothetical protein VK539_26370 [Myxococcaceae bacterium]|nr:hypothetical protein [Myxococcaceae bacterium]